MSDVEFDFSNEIQNASWKLLKPHHDRGGLFIVADNLDLATVAHAIAKDKANIVKIWLDNSELLKVEDNQVERFDTGSDEEIAKFIIVQPYVLVQFFK